MNQDIRKNATKNQSNTVSIAKRKNIATNITKYQSIAINIVLSIAKYQNIAILLQNIKGLK